MTRRGLPAATRALAPVPLTTVRLAAVLLTTVLASVLWQGGAASAVGSTDAQDPPPEDTTVPTTTAPIITTTLPTGNGEVGRIIPLPNSGAEPEEPGDRGGWQQLALFVLVCVVIVGMGLFVWWRSHKARDQRRATGHDPVVMAREHGADVRGPRPPGITD